MPKTLGLAELVQATRDHLWSLRRTSLVALGLKGVDDPEPEAQMPGGLAEQLTLIEIYYAGWQGDTEGFERVRSQHGFHKLELHIVRQLLPDDRPGVKIRAFTQLVADLYVQDVSTMPGWTSALALATKIIPSLCWVSAIDFIDAQEDAELGWIEQSVITITIEAEHN